MTHNKTTELNRPRLRDLIPRRDALFDMDGRKQRGKAPRSSWFDDDETVFVTCPNCRRTISIVPPRFSIAKNGDVFPPVQCKSCGWLRFVRLENFDFSSPATLPFRHLPSYDST